MNGWAEKLEPLWNEWTVADFLGEGSCGKVWKIKRETRNGLEFAALKEIVISTAEGNYKQALTEGLDISGMRVFFKSVLEETKQEILFMQELGYCPNIVHCEDYVVYTIQGDNAYVESDDNNASCTDGWVVFIRMELLIPFKTRLMSSILKIEDIRKLGIDICNALDACSEHEIIHRDVKPENIFWSETTNTYKLGDFGIAHYLTRPTEGKGRAGTLTHMPPEVFNGAPFTKQADLYALGMILYRLLNDNRIPFLEHYPIPFTPRERDGALVRRLKGENPPPPRIIFYAQDNNISKFGISLCFCDKERKTAIELGKISQKAISSNPKDRFSSSAELRKELEEIHP